MKLLSGTEKTITFQGAMLTMAFIEAAAAALQKEAKKLRIYRAGEEIRASHVTLGVPTLEDDDLSSLSRYVIAVQCCH